MFGIPAHLRNPFETPQAGVHVRVDPRRLFNGKAPLARGRVGIRAVRRKAREFLNSCTDSQNKPRKTIYIK